MGLFDGCLLVSDIDGTLLTNGEIPQKNLDAIDWFKSEGGVFTIATGRAVIAGKESYELSHANAPMIALNGGMIYDFEKQEYVYQSYLDERCKDMLFDILAHCPEIGADIMYGLDVFPLQYNDAIRYHAEYERFTLSPLPEDIRLIPWNKVLFAANDMPSFLALQNYCESLQVDFCRFVVTSVSARHKYYEILPIGSDKGTGIRKLKEILGAKRSYGIGDFYNDLELIRDADVGAATAAAPEEIKQLADYVTCPCIEGAVADFIDKIALEMKGSSVWTR